MVCILYLVPLAAQSEVYYVSSVGSQCNSYISNNSRCHPISYYTSNDVWSPYSPNVTLIFLAGEHNLKTSFFTKGLKHMRLLGQNPFLVTPFDTHLFSRPVITCHKMREFVIIGITSLAIEWLTIKCSVLKIINLKELDLSKIIGKSLNVSIIQSVMIYDSHFTHEKLSNTFSGVASLSMHSTYISGMSNGLYFDSGDLFCYVLLTDLIIANSRMNGITIMCRHDGLVSLNQVTVTNSGSHGLYLKCKYSMGTKCFMSLSDIILADSILGTNILCYQEKCSGYINNITICNTAKSVGLIINCQQKCEIDINAMHILNNSAGGFNLLSAFQSSFFIRNSIISQNGGVGIITLCYSVMFIDFSNVTISKNNDTGLYLGTFCIVGFFFNNSIISDNHSPTSGGGMWISNNCYVRGNATLSLINNTAQEMGGAIYSPEHINAKTECTFFRISAVFKSNRAALSGNNIYNGVYWQCIYMYNTTNGQNIYLSDKNLFTVAVDCSNNPSLSLFPKPHSMYITSIPLGVCLCRDNATDCNTRFIDIAIFPGQSMTVSLATVGFCGGFSPTVLMTNNSGSVGISLETINQETENRCKDFKYLLSQLYPHKKEGEVILATHTRRYKDSSLSIKINFLPCPFGLKLVSGTCQCDADIKNDNTQCNIDWLPHPIRRHGNSWLYYSQQNNCTVAHHNCPFDYCVRSTVYLSLNESDLQCSNGRSGILCGKCNPGLSLVLGSNKCRSCSNKYISIVIAFILAGISLLLFLLVCNLTVSVGSINGLLFFANVVKLNEVVLFPDGVEIPVLSQFIAWLNLDLGVQICFFSGLDGYWKTWLQFGFPLVLIATILLCCRFSSKLSHLFGRNIVSVLSTLILMAHSKLLLAIRNALMLTVIKCGKETWYTWSIDGNIAYLSSMHIPLFVFSLFMLLVGLMYTLTIFSSQWMMTFCGKYCRSSMDPFYRFKPFIDSYTGPYKDKFRYWTGFLLIVRLLLTTIFSYTTGTIPQVNNYITASTAFVTLFLSRGVYVDKRLNLLEYFYLFNLASLSLINALLHHMAIGHHIIVKINAVLISLALIVFIGTILIHIYVSLKRKYGCCNKVQNSEEETLLQGNEDHCHEEEMFSPAQIINRREPLIFDFDLK